MARMTIGRRPELTAEDVMQVFRKHFGDRYEVYPTPELAAGRAFSIKWDFLVRKNAFVGVRVRLNQEPDKTELIFAGSAPTPFVNFLLMFMLGLPSLFLFNGLMNEVRALIQQGQEFR